MQAGMPFNVDFSTSKKSDPMMVRGGCVYGVAGEERAAYFTKIVDDAGIECLFDTAVETLIYDEAGVVSGIQCVSGKEVIDVKAKAVVLATGGFLGSPEETAKHFAGAKIVNMGNMLNTGAGIKALGNKVGTVTADSIKVKVTRISFVIPFGGIIYGFLPLIRKGNKHGVKLLSSYLSLSSSYGKSKELLQKP